MARKKEKVALPKGYQLNALADAILEAKAVIRDAKRILEVVDLSGLGLHDKALVLTIKEDSKRYLENYYSETEEA